MAFSLFIKQSGLFKKKLDAAELRKQLGGAVHVGGIGNFSIFADEPDPPAENGDVAFMLYGRTGPIGRGFTLHAQGGFATVELCCPLPTTTHDLQDFFLVAGLLAKYFGAKELYTEDGGAIHQAALTARFAELREENGHLLKNFVAGRKDGLAVAGVFMPLYLPESLCRHIEGVPPENAEVFFSAYLDEKQGSDYYYMKPLFYHKEDGTPFAGYALTESVPSIIPRQPFVPYPPSPVQEAEVSEWLLVMVAQQGGSIGRLPYQNFIERLEPGEYQDFDDKHYLLKGLSQRRMRAILEGADS